ncbi:hypothetical protein H6F86_05505 [Phormidium sp. FACHB-592]|uniref:Uncharacterized protein n=1 Tax=Stenomitos frigidus AS-A4 TaxID=2933935 RepID=A0ABV0KP73_9CYAN|nr:hypothetical protein [Phormidium sp. FACHB-592]
MLSSLLLCRQPSNSFTRGKAVRLTEQATALSRVISSYVQTVISYVSTVAEVEQ